MKNIINALVVVGCLMIVGLAQSAVADPHCRACPYSCSDLGLGHKDCSNMSPGASGVCCVDLTQKGLDLALEQDRVLGQKAPIQASQDRCPAGYSPSEQKCSQEERRRGCKDIRLPSGLGCVRR